MAIIAEVTKVMPSLGIGGAHLTLSDDDVEVLSKTYNHSYPKRHAYNTDKHSAIIADMEIKVKESMQADIDAYKRKKAFFESSAYGDAIKRVQEGLVL